MRYFQTYYFSADKNKALLTKGCISPFHVTPELKEHLFNLGGEWKFIPDKKGLNKGIKFADPIVLTPENTECKSVHLTSRVIQDGVTVRKALVQF